VKAIGAGPGGDPGSAIRSAARLELAQLARQGKLEVKVAASYPLAEVEKAHRELAGGHSHGKVVLIP
jgi:NADPH:quinone reductase-like Zn-dependent oxidoreductase